MQSEGSMPEGVGYLSGGIPLVSIDPNRLVINLHRLPAEGILAIRLYYGMAYFSVHGLFLIGFI